jgi:hypothetical protein
MTTESHTIVEFATQMTPLVDGQQGEAEQWVIREVLRGSPERIANALADAFAVVFARHGVLVDHSAYRVPAG